MKRFLAYFLAIAFCSVVFALVNDGLNLMLIRSSWGNPAYKMERLWSDAFPDEVAILGSSRAQGNFMPSRMSPTCFDYGADGMGMPEVLFFLRHLARRKTSAPVIVNLDPWGFGGFDSPCFVGDYRLAPQSGRTRFVDALPGLRFHGALRKSLVAWLNQRKAVTKVIDAGAVLLKTSRTPVEWDVINAKLTPWGFTRSVEGEKEFEEAMRSLAPRKVIVVVGPCASHFMELYPSMDEFSRYLEHLRTIDNVIVVNMFGDTDFSDSDFTDPTHLNIRGAAKFTEKVMRAVGHVIHGKVEVK